MRYPESHKAEVRARIVREAATALRAEGIAAVSIPAIMSRAGLTHGGFYGHFAGRDALVAAAIEQAGADTARGVFAPEVPLEEALARYLSLGHAAHPEQGCVVAALASEGAHTQSPEVREAFARVAQGLLGLVAAKLDDDAASDAPGDDALRLAATMVGAVLLARLVDDEPLATRILEAARRR